MADIVELQKVLAERTQGLEYTERQDEIKRVQTEYGATDAELQEALQLNVALRMASANAEIIARPLSPDDEETARASMQAGRKVEEEGTITRRGLTKASGSRGCFSAALLALLLAAWAIAT